MCSLLLTKKLLHGVVFLMIYIIIAILVFIGDIISKYIAEQNLIYVRTIPLIENVFHLTYVENRGMAFGMFSGGRVLFIIVSVVVLVLLIMLFKKTEISARTVWQKAGTALIFSGALGNLVERISKGYVVDFLDFTLIDFPVFNIADIAVCVGAGMLVIHFLLAERKDGKNALKGEKNNG